MKKIFLTLAAASALIFSACNSGGKTGMSDTAKKNLETARAIGKMFENTDLSKAGDYFATDAVEHESMNGQDIKGLDSMKANFAGMFTMMKDFKNDIVKELADDDYTFQWVKESWTMKVDGMSGKAGSTGSANVIEVCKFKDGKVSDHWSFMDFTDMMKMMPQASATDTSGHK